MDAKLIRLHPHHGVVFQTIEGFTAYKAVRVRSTVTNKSRWRCISLWVPERALVRAPIYIDSSVRSFMTRKIRVNMATPIKMFSLHGEDVVWRHDYDVESPLSKTKLTYRRGIQHSVKFDVSIKDCSTGIHCFWNLRDACLYTR